VNKDKKMVPKKSLQEKKHKNVVWLLPKFALAAVCAGILMYVLASPRLAAQTGTAAQTKSNPCEEPELKPAPKCVVSPPKDAKPPSTYTEYVQDALATEWLNKDGLDGTTHVLNAFALLVCSSQDPDVVNSETCKPSGKLIGQPPGVFLQALQDLEKGVQGSRANSVCNRDKAVYEWALGEPDATGETAAGMPNFIDTVAKANTLGIKGKTKDEQDLPRSELFACTKKIIEGIYELDNALILPEISRYFSGSTYGRYLGLILLMERVQSADENYHDVASDPKAPVKCDADCAARMEKLRAAFELDADRLGSQIAAKVSAPPKQ
jgi:hypothetical protein